MQEKEKNKLLNCDNSHEYHADTSEDSTVSIILSLEKRMLPFFIIHLIKSAVSCVL